ncbi:MAG TPA: electron transfer flavoprotein subunit alpha/FixB family protein, partial [Blastocatellia bacterium]|nr:electron transfer flavoprotein subunit alpha/FixB family protein [Blastocatellia bacterium]
MSEGILLFVEQRDGALNRTSFEALVAAQQIAAASGDKISAVVLGKGVAGVAGDVAGKKVEAVYTVEDDKLGEYTPDG